MQWSVGNITVSRVRFAVPDQGVADILACSLYTDYGRTCITVGLVLVMLLGTGQFCCYQSLL